MATGHVVLTRDRPVHGALDAGCSGCSPWSSSVNVINTHHRGGGHVTVALSHLLITRTSHRHLIRDLRRPTPGPTEIRDSHDSVDDNGDGFGPCSGYTPR